MKPALTRRESAFTKWKPLCPSLPLSCSGEGLSMAAVRLAVASALLLAHHIGAKHGQRAGGRRDCDRGLRRLRRRLRLRARSGSEPRGARQVRGRLQGRAGEPCLRGDRDRRPQCLRRARLRGGAATGRGAEHGAAAVLPVRRQGLRHPRLGVRRQGLIAARPRFLGVLKKSRAYQGLARNNTAFVAFRLRCAQPRLSYD